MENPGTGVKLSTVGPAIKMQKLNYKVCLVIWGILQFYFNPGLYHKCIGCFLIKVIDIILCIFIITFFIKWSIDGGTDSD